MDVGHSAASNSDVNTAWPHPLHGHGMLLDNDMIYLLTAIELTPGGSSTVHIYT